MTKTETPSPPAQTSAELELLHELLGRACTDNRSSQSEAEWYVLMGARQFVFQRLLSAKFGDKAGTP